MYSNQTIGTSMKQTKVKNWKMYDVNHKLETTHQSSATPPSASVSSGVYCSIVNSFEH